MTMTAQEIFSKSATHLLRQRAVSRTEFVGGGGTICAYRGRNGTSCAVGCLIPDDIYDKKMENLQVLCLIHLPGIPDLLGAGNIEILEALQLVHDQKAVSDWETELRAVAARFRLDFPEVAK